MSRKNVNVMDIDLDKLPAGALKQLVEEVRNEDYEATRDYDRVHNRHNRGRGGSDTLRDWPSDEDKAISLGRRRQRNA